MTVTIVNRTVYDTTAVRKIVRGVLRDFECNDVTVTIVHTRGRSPGYARGHYRDFWFPSRGESGPQIRVSLPKPGVPIGEYHPYKRRDSPGPFSLLTWQEALVAITAHEAQHHRQSRRRQKMVEVDCDWAAYRAVSRWRERPTVSVVTDLC